VEEFIAQVIFPFLFPVSSGWHTVLVWKRTNLGLDVTKPTSFSTAYEGLQKCCCVEITQQV